MLTPASRHCEELKPSAETERATKPADCQPMPLNLTVLRHTAGPTDAHLLADADRAAATSPTEKRGGAEKSSMQSEENSPSPLRERTGSRTLSLHSVI